MFDQAFGIDATVRCKCVEGSEEKWVYASGAETEMHVCVRFYLFIGKHFTQVQIMGSCFLTCWSRGKRIKGFHGYYLIF